ncbi:hypothetical protein ATN89_17610 [Comamonas thiooxydans]|nr:hypothetical protein ATN89_17610 [Comamonas thiooxydans]
MNDSGRGTQTVISYFLAEERVSSYQGTYTAITTAEGGALVAASSGLISLDAMLDGPEGLDEDYDWIYIDHDDQEREWGGPGLLRHRGSLKEWQSCEKSLAVPGDEDVMDALSTYVIEKHMPRN